MAIFHNLFQLGIIIFDPPDEASISSKYDKTSVPTQRYFGDRIPLIKSSFDDIFEAI